MPILIIDGTTGIFACCGIVDTHSCQRVFKEETRNMPLVTYILIYHRLVTSHFKNSIFANFHGRLGITIHSISLHGLKQRGVTKPIEDALTAGLLRTPGRWDAFHLFCLSSTMSDSPFLNPDTYLNHWTPDNAFQVEVARNLYLAVLGVRFPIFDVGMDERCSDILYYTICRH